MDQELNLYIDLHEGELADLEVVARASLAFAEAVREIAYILDPSLTVRLEIDSGTKGSLSLNSVVKFIKKAVLDPVTRAAVISAILTWFAQETGSYLYGKIVDEVVTEDTAISDDDATRIAEKVKELLERGAGRKPIQDVFKELEKDKSVKGVGVGTAPGRRPARVVPREEFRERMEDQSESAQDGEKRTRRDRMSLTLISPVLTKNKNKWRFLSRDGLISAELKDEQFLNDLISGAAHIPMKGGILFSAIVEIKEERHDGVWQIKERNVLKVTNVDAGVDGQEDLFPNESK